MARKEASLTPAERAIIANAVPGFESLLDQDAFKSRLTLVDAAAGDRLPPDGMYIVLNGSVRLLLNGNEIAQAGRADYFYEEHLVLDDLAVELTAHASDDARLLLLSKATWQSIPDETKQACLAQLFGDLVNIHMHEFQQPINCCNITAAALSLTALGFSCDVNDIFTSCALPVSYVVNEGMTLGELYDVASSYVFAAGLRDEVGVELYYFDKAVMTRQDLYDAIAESDRVGGDNDILVANFGVGIAHGRDMGGGHFALIAKCNQSTGLVHMMDVHPEKYGKIWVTSIDRLYDAMADYDNSAMRSRGLMRFIVKREIDVRLDTLAKSDCYPVNATLYLDLTPEKRRHIFGRSTPNLNSLHVLAMALGILDNHPVDVDEILDIEHISYTEALTLETTTERLAGIAIDYLTKADYPNIACEYRRFDGSGDATKDGWFKQQMLSVANNPDAFCIINIDYNEVMGFEAIREPVNQLRETPLLREFWCVVIDYQYENDVVILADMSPATSQVWRAPRKKLFAGLREKQSSGVLYLQKRAAAMNPLDVQSIAAQHPLVLFADYRDKWSSALQSILGNIGASDVHLVDLSGFGTGIAGLRKKLAQHAGFEATPYLYFNGECIGDMDTIMAGIMNGSLQRQFNDAGLPVLLREETPSLNNNIFSYPRVAATLADADRRNVLLCACGSPAAEQITELVERLCEAGHHIKLLLTKTAGVFLEDIGMERILVHIRPSDVYRDADEWNFRYNEPDMQIRATHLALCDWADCVVVAPLTTNTLSKTAQGAADNLLTSVLAAWPYTSKPAILCPACHYDMWNNPAVQSNVLQLHKMGARLTGPRTVRLANGREVTGMMAAPQTIMQNLEQVFSELHDNARTIFHWARLAAGSDDTTRWNRVIEAIDNGIVPVDITEEESGDSLLHYAAGGEGQVTESQVIHGKAHPAAVVALLHRGSSVNPANNFGCTPLQVAVQNGAIEIVKQLLDAGADTTGALQADSLNPDIRELLAAASQRVG